MPQFGRREAASTIAPAGNSAQPPLPWRFPGGTAQMVTFEVDVQASLDSLPDLLSRPAPPYARIVVLDYPESPIGPYREAQLLVACRFAMLPRQYLAASVVTSEAARAANLAHWRYASEVGEIDFTQAENVFSSRIRMASGFEVHIHSGEAQETGVAAIRYDPTLIVDRREDGSPGLATISAEPDVVTQAWIARDTRVEYANPDRSSPWWRLRSLNPITSTIAVQDMELGEPKPVRAGPMVSAG